MFNNSSYDECNITPTTTNIIAVVLLVTIMAVTVVGNIVVIVMISMSRVLQVQTTNYLLASLSLADLLTGLVSMPIKINQSYHNQLFCMSEPTCWFYTISDTMFSITSVMHLVMVAMDRYVAIKYTYKYHQLFTRRNVQKLAFVCWFYAIVWSLLLIVRWDSPKEYGLYFERKYCYQQNYYYFLTVTLLNYLLPTIVIAFTYSYVYSTALKHIKAICATEVSAPVDASRLKGVLRTSNSRQRREFDALNTSLRRHTPTGSDTKSNRRKKREFKALKTVLIVFIAFTICWLPANLLTVSILFTRAQQFWTSLKENHRQTFEAIFFVCVQILPPAQSALNPFIYVIFNKHYRLSFQALMKRMAGDKAVLRRLERRLTFFSITQLNMVNLNNKRAENNSSDLIHGQKANCDDVTASYNTKVNDSNSHTMLIGV